MMGTNFKLGLAECVLCDNNSTNNNDIYKPQNFCMISQVSRKQQSGETYSYTAVSIFFTGLCLATSSTNLNAKFRRSEIQVLFVPKTGSFYF